MVDLPGCLMTSVEAALDRLRSSYERKLSGELRSLIETVDRARTNDGPVAAVNTARVHAHRLHGTAGSYGFGTVSVACAELENALGRWLAEADRSRRWHEIIEALDRVRKLESSRSYRRTISAVDRGT